MILRRYTKFSLHRSFKTKVENVRYIPPHFYDAKIMGPIFFLINMTKQISLPNSLLLSAMKMFGSFSTTIPLLSDAQLSERLESLGIIGAQVRTPPLKLLGPSQRTTVLSNGTPLCREKIVSKFFLSESINYRL